MYMTYIKIGNEEYLTVKDAYLNLCVARNAISKKIKFLEKNGYILRVKNKGLKFISAEKDMKN